MDTMDTTIDLISDDDESFSEVNLARFDEKIILSTDGETDTSHDHMSSDEDLPNVALQQKKSVIIRNLFPTSQKNNAQEPASYTKNKKNSAVVSHFFPTSQKDNGQEPAPNQNSPGFGPSMSNMTPQKPRDPGVNRMIEGVQINLPVNPYGCQVALMSMMIKAIKRGQNCLLESPTGSGKTLALLCGALGWLSAEKKLKSEQQAQNFLAAHPELHQVDQATEHIASPMKKPATTPEKFFSKNSFGEKTIYDKPTPGKNPTYNEDSPEKGKVRIHKRKLHCMEGGSTSKMSSPKKMDSMDSGGMSKVSSPKHVTPEKNIDQPVPESPSELHVPIIYYGARTHKQLQQVIKEFGRTSYSDHVRMTVLSSREHSCIREFDKQMWGTRNEMCKGCVRKIVPLDKTHRSKEETNCKYYDNRQVLKHDRLPAAFDLEDLVKAGHELVACPYYAAREMANHADIVFCPYNYLIEKSIRTSMKIDLEGNIVIIDEAHNIEDICRDSATFVFTRENIQGALKELEIVAQYRYASSNQEVLNDVDKLTLVMKNWDYWFSNQKQLVDSAPVTNNEAVYMWQSEQFVKTLENHNIGRTHYQEFSESSIKFCQQLQNDPRSLYGVTQATGTLVESIETALGYLFRSNGKYMDDFKPVLVKSVTGDTYGAATWRNLQFKKKIESESLSLRLFCLNPAIVFEDLKVAKCIALASGTLTPLISLHSELDTEFPLKISPSHVIPPDRVWIGTLTSHLDGRALQCRRRDTEQLDTQDALGHAVLWVCGVTPHGVLCFVPSYHLMHKLVNRWRETGVWKQLNDVKHVFQENRNSRDHNDIMEDYYKYVATDKGALLFAVYRGKVSEGMDFKDHQARAVITVGVPYPNTFDMAVKAKMEFNDKYSRERNLLTGQQWLKVQAYRALNQAVGRCVRHKGDWGAVLLIDNRFQAPFFTEHLSKWVLNFLERNHHTFESLLHSPNSLESFMQHMTIREDENEAL